MSIYLRKRSSVIPYFFACDELRFILAVPRGYADRLADFGGGMEEGENWITAMTRELDEESYGLIKVNDPKCWLTSEYKNSGIVNNKLFFAQCEPCDNLKSKVESQYLINQETKGGDHWQTLSIVIVNSNEMRRLLRSFQINNKYTSSRLLKVMDITGFNNVENAINANRHL
jgi:hypothetical protein